MNGTDRLLEEIRVAADRVRDAEHELQEGRWTDEAEVAEWDDLR